MTTASATLLRPLIPFGKTFYSPLKDGAVPIRVGLSGRRTYYTAFFEDKPRRYWSSKRLIQDLTGGRSKTSSLATYLKLKDPIPGDVLDVFGVTCAVIKSWRPKPLDQRLTTRSSQILHKADTRISLAHWAGEGLDQGLDQGIVVAIGRGLPYPPAPESDILVAFGPDKGIDLANRGVEVAKLFFAGLKNLATSGQLSLEDALQEVYKGLLIRNKGKCPWDPNKSSFSHYVHMVARQLLLNMMRKETRVRRIQPGVMAYSNGQWQEVDVAAADFEDQKANFNNSGAGMCEVVDSLARFIALGPKGHSRDGRNAIFAIPLMVEGRGRSEIAEILGIPKLHASAALKCLREQAALWRERPVF